MRKTLFLFVCLLLFSAIGSQYLKEQGSYQTMQQMGIPVEFLKEQNMPNDEMKLYKVFWEDLKYFPIPIRISDSWDIITYEDTWMEERSYGGKRKHEGCDLFGKQETPGYYPVISMTSGKVENIGWLPLGGYRIGIRSPNGGYFYYAHLHSYAGNFKIGDRVNSGEVLGFMGDTGYGEEGTRGKFVPHLHLGIYVETKDAKEYAVDPYWALQYLEKNKVKYEY